MTVGKESYSIFYFCIFWMCLRNTHAFVTFLEDAWKQWKNSNCVHTTAVYAWVELERWDIRKISDFVFWFVCLCFFLLVGNISNQFTYEASMIFRLFHMQIVMHILIVMLERTLRVPQTSDFLQNYFDLHSSFSRLFWKCLQILQLFISTTWRKRMLLMFKIGSQVNSKNCHLMNLKRKWYQNSYPFIIKWRIS